MSNLDFEILIDNSFADVCTDKSVLPNHNKFVLSLINDFEDGEWRYEDFKVLYGIILLRLLYQS